MDVRVDQLQRSCANDPRVIGLAGGLPASTLFPREELAASAARVLRREGEQALQYTWPEGRESLRAWIAARLSLRGLAVRANEVVITNGAHEAISIIASLLLGADDAVAIDACAYPSALDVFRARGARFVSFDCAARLAYTMPAITNPEGHAADARTREMWLAWAQRHQSYVLEDDAYADLRFDHAAPPTIAGRARERVFHVGTFSKTLCPGLRLGWLVAPPAHRDEIIERKRLRDLQGNTFSQAMLDDFLARDDFDARLVHARRFYSQRADALIEALRRRLPEAQFESPAGGFSLWATFPSFGDDTELLAHAVREGVSFDPGSLFLTRTARETTTRMRLCFSTEEPSRFDEGVTRLARAFRAWREDYRAGRGRSTSRAL